MEEILVLGGLPNGDQQKIALYTSIANVCKNYAQRVYTPLDTAEFKGDDTQTYQRAKLRVDLADLLVGEQSNPSTGQGVEIGLAIPQNKPLIVVAKTGSKVSGVVKGCSILKDVVYYDSIPDLEQKLPTALAKYV